MKSKYISINECACNESMVKLDCEHEINKEHLIDYAIGLFLEKKAYRYSCFCQVCNKIEKLKRLPLYCGCVWVDFGKVLPSTNYTKCNSNKPLTPIDFSLINDYMSLKFVFKELSDHLKGENKFIDKSNNIIRNEEIEDIVWTIKNTTVITKLNLSYHYHGDKDGKLIGEALRTNNSLTLLNFNYNLLRGDSIKKICNSLRNNTKLTVLELSSNNIDFEGGTIIGRMLKFNTTLEQLNLSYNLISDQGVHEIGKALKVNRILKKLNLCKNEITSISTLCEALKVNKTLIHLRLDQNFIRGEDIGKAMMVNKGLVQLYLNGCKIDNEGAKIIGRALKVNVTLKDLDLGHNLIEAKGFISICEAAKVNRILTKLKLNYSKIGNEEKELLKSVRENFPKTTIHFC